MDGNALKLPLTHPRRDHRTVVHDIPARHDGESEAVYGILPMRQHIVDSNQRHLLRLEGQTNLGGHERFASAEKVAQHHGMGVIKVIGSGHVRVRVNPEQSTPILPPYRSLR